MQALSHLQPAASNAHSGTGAYAPGGTGAYAPGAAAWAASASGEPLRRAVAAAQSNPVTHTVQEV